MDYPIQWVFYCIGPSHLFHTLNPTWEVPFLRLCVPIQLSFKDVSVSGQTWYNTWWLTLRLELSLRRLASFPLFPVWGPASPWPSWSSSWGPEASSGKTWGSRPHSIPSLIRWPRSWIWSSAPRRGFSHTDPGKNNKISLRAKLPMLVFA